MTALTHRQFLAWEAWRDAEDWDRWEKWEHYLARAYAAEHLTKKGEKVDVRKGLIPFTRELKAKPTKATRKAREAAEWTALKAGLAMATGGGKGVRHHVRHPDGSVTDAKTGELVKGPD